MGRSAFAKTSLRHKSRVETIATDMVSCRAGAANPCGEHHLVTCCRSMFQGVYRAKQLKVNSCHFYTDFIILSFKKMVWFNIWCTSQRPNRSAAAERREGWKGFAAMEARTVNVRDIEHNICKLNRFFMLLVLFFFALNPTPKERANIRTEDDLIKRCHINHN